MPGPDPAAPLSGLAGPWPGPEPTGLRPRLDPAGLLAAWEGGARQAPLERALRLFSAATGIAPDTAAGWDLGSRDRVLATLLEGSAGPVAAACLDCAGCGERLDVPVELAAVPRSPIREPGARLRTEVPGATVSFRLPTTEDVRAVHGLDPAEARWLLLERCLGPEAPAVASEEAALAVEAAMERACPGGAVEVVVGCPGCGATTTAALDVAVLLWAEIEARAVALLRDVHALALAYGWTEPDVLALSPVRRAAYLEMAGA
jgi:hypothetical protein